MSIFYYIYICLYNPYNNSIHTNLQNHPSLGIFGSPGWTTLHSPGRTGHPEGRMVGMSRPVAASVFETEWPCRALGTRLDFGKWK